MVKRGFSLAEALVVMAIISIFFAAATKIITTRPKPKIQVNPHGYFECYKLGGTQYQRSVREQLEIENKAANPSPELQIPEEDTAARLSSVGSRPASSAVAEQVTTQSRGIAEDTGSANPADELTTPAADTAARLPLSSRTTFSADQSERFTTQSPGTAPESNIPESDSVWGRVANAVRRVLGLEDQATNEVEVDAVEAPSRLQVQGLLKEETGVPEEELLTKELDAVIDYREDGTPVTGREFIRSETVAADEINKFADVLPDASECVYRNNGI